MSNSYYWDLGFDFNAVQNSSGGPSFLENGFVLGAALTVDGQKKTGVPATPVDLSIGDTIVFNAFNTTSNLSPSATYTLVSGTISFSGAEVDQVTVSPFNSTGSTTPQQTFNMNASAQLQQGPSIVFDGIQAPDPAPSTTQQNFPFWTVAGPLTIANQGRFLMHVTMTVQGPDGKRIFVTDPEMVVGSIG